MTEIVSTLLKSVGAVVLAGGAVTIAAYHLFKFLGRRWLESKFSERLEAFKHAQQREIEQLRLEINTLFDRTIKLHQREFDVLPEVWALLTDAYSNVHNVGLGIVRYPDVDRMTAEQLDEFLEKSHLQTWQKSELRHSSNKTKYYADAVAWRDLTDARKAFGDFHFYLLKNGIFVETNLKKQFEDFDELFHQVLIEREMSLQHPTTQKFEKGVELHSNGKSKLKSLEQSVQGRLWSSADSQRLAK